MMRELFESRFGSSQGARLVTAPGRVNLIGEHTDYNLLPVFPMALQFGIRILFRPRGDASVRLASTAPGFGDRSFELQTEIQPYAAGDWGNYVKAAAQAVAEHWNLKRGMDAVVSGDLPMSAGLSSSSAMVVASALALLDVDRVAADRIELAELMAAAEHYVGTHGGGMDQAICLGGKRGHAALIEFAPLRITPVAVPEHWRFLVAHSMVKANKSAGAREHYNQCVADCRAAAAIMGDFRTLVGAANEEDVLAQGQARLEDRLFHRFRHQVSEGRRVYLARDAMAAGDAKRFGSLMLASHRSMRDDYLISCPEVDQLVDTAMTSGAIGARMTGAGFGGFVVALTDAANVDSLIRRLDQRFYAARGVSGVMAGHLFQVEPSGGAAVSLA
ncbi:MAG: galactokinase [Bryobacteraceae bacterium]